VRLSGNELAVEKGCMVYEFRMFLEDFQAKSSSVFLEFCII
jgi:hypothetical protein